MLTIPPVSAGAARTSMVDPPAPSRIVRVCGARSGCSQKLAIDSVSVMTPSLGASPLRSLSLRRWPNNRGVIRYRLGAGAASVRWAMSPIHEVVGLAQLLTEPQRHPMFHPWLRRRHHRLSDLDLRALTVFMADGAYR